MFASLWRVGGCRSFPPRLLREGTSLLKNASEHRQKKAPSESSECWVSQGHHKMPRRGGKVVGEWGRASIAPARSGLTPPAGAPPCCSITHGASCTGLVQPVGPRPASGHRKAAHGARGGNRGPDLGQSATLHS